MSKAQGKSPGNAVKRLLCSAHTPFVALWLFMAVCHLLFKLGTGDDANYATVIPTQGLWNYLVWAWRNWSARTLVDVGMCVLNWLPGIVWRLLNPLAIIGVAWGAAGIAGVRKNAPACWVVCGLVLLYPWQEMASAGWVTTTLVYLWPAAAAMLALVPTAAVLRGEQPRLWVCALSLPALLYAANMEQILILTLPLLCLAVGALLVTRQKPHWLLWAQLGCLVADLIWLLACPGPKARFEGEMVSWFPNFGMKSIFSKVELGASAALAPLVYAQDAIFLLFCLLLAWVVWARYQNWLYRAVSLLPAAACLAFGFGQRVVLALLPQLSFFTEALTGEGSVTLANCNSLAAYLPMLLLYFVFAACLVGLYLAFGHSGRALAAMAALCCGLLSRAAMGFTPTIWVSGPRTGLFFSLTLAVLAAMLYRGAQSLPVRALPKATRGGRAWRAARAVFWALFVALCLVQLYSVQEMRIATGY